MLGNLPSGYNKAVHGPYDPAVFYGKPDLPLSQVMILSLFHLLNSDYSGEGLPAACLASSSPVLQPHCLRAGFVQVKLIIKVDVGSLEILIIFIPGLTGAGTTSTVSPSTVESLLSFRCLSVSPLSSTSWTTAVSLSTRTKNTTGRYWFNNSSAVHSLR